MPRTENSQQKVHEEPILEKKKSGFLNEFLWSCAGVNKEILRQCPSDYAKYAGIGGTILFTALMACFSGGYALSFVFGKWWVGLVFGIFWGLLIFNLDRFIVNTMYSDGKVTISWQEIKSGLPRIIMAIFLGIVISYPLELKIFEDKIKMEIESEKVNLLNKQLLNLTSEIEKYEDEIMALEQGVGDIYRQERHTGNIKADMLIDSINQNQPKLNQLQSDIQSLYRQKNHLDPNSSSYESQTKKIKNQITNLQVQRSALSGKIRKWQQEKNELTTRLDDIESRQNDYTMERRNKLLHDKDSVSLIISQARTVHKDWDEETIRQKGSIIDKINLEYNGFIAQMLAFEKIKNEKLNEDKIELFNSAKTASILIMLLFIIIETAPTFFKMMMEDGPYDDLLRAEMHRAKVLSDKRISDVNDEVNTEVKISTMKNQQRLEAEAIANENILKQIALAQSELIKIAIEKWKAEELKKIKENPLSYIKMTTEEEKV